MHYRHLPCQKNIYVEVSRLERITETLSKVGASRRVLRRSAMSIIGVAAAVLLLSIVLVKPDSTVQAQTASITWHTTIRPALLGSETNGTFGYNFDSKPANALGQITDRNFILDGETYHLNRLVWQASSDTIEMEFEECLKLSDVVSITIGETTFYNSDIDWEEEEDKECEDDSDDEQEFEIYGVTANPLDEATVEVDISLGPSTPWPTTNPWTTHINPVRKGTTDNYGYEFDAFGSIDDRSFWYEGVTYRIEQIVLDDGDNELLVEFDKCLKSTDLVSLQIGATTYLVSSLDADDIDESDSDCDSSLRSNQEFVFEARSNPLNSGEKEITLTFRGNQSTTSPQPGPGVCPLAPNSVSGSGAKNVCLPTPTPVPATLCAVQSLEDVTDNVTYSSTWGNDCRGNSTNVPSSDRQKSYSRYFSFTLSRKALLDIQLETSRLSTPKPHLYLMRRVGNSDTLVASVAPGEKGVAHIVHELPKGTSNITYTYIIEATTLTRQGSKGEDFRLKVRAYELETRPTSDTVISPLARHNITNGKEVYLSRVMQEYEDFSPYGVTLKGDTQLYLTTQRGCLDHRRLRILSGSPSQRLSGTNIHPLQCPPDVGPAREAKYVWRLFRDGNGRFLHGPAYPKKSVTSMTVTADSYYTTTPMGSPYSIGWEVRFPMDPFEGDVQKFCLNCE